MDAKKCGAAVALLVLAMLDTALAADPPFPVAGRLYDTVENGWTNYECDPPEGGLLTCRFTQIKVMRQTSGEDAVKQKAVMAAEITKGVSAEQWKDSCSLAPDLSAIGTGQVPENATAEIKRLAERATPVMRKDMAAQAAALNEACQAHSTSALKRFAELGIEAKERTCEVLTNPYTQIFRAQFNAHGSLSSWSIADTTPQGDCGFINLSRFVPVIERPGEAPYLWQYYARRVTSNRQATSVLGKCSDFEEREILHDWRRQTIFLQCDYIEGGL